jgi:hypothetical protein
VARVFISYSHEDQEFVLALVERLQERGLNVRFDRVVLQVGDSLIRTLAQEISEGDFLVAVVSPDSVSSDWCQTELALARTQGINERRVKVLPIRYRGARMPPVLDDVFWADADTDDVTTVAQKLAAAIRTHQAGGDERAVNEAAGAASEGGTIHLQPRRDEGAAVHRLADEVFDLLVQWDACLNGAPTPDLEDRQRRLRWESDALHDDVKTALPLVRRLVVSDWNDFFRVHTPRELEGDLLEELNAVRRQLTQGLPVIARWAVTRSRRSS